MSKRKKVSVIVANNRHAFKKYRRIQLVSATTGGAAKIGVIYASIATTGADTGKVYVAINTAGTGTVITD